jgi:TatD DNase family protein
MVLWGVGCHPTDSSAQAHFNVKVFENLLTRTGLVGEIGLDKKSEVPFESQVKVFRAILEVVADHPRIVSIHSNHATAEVLDELQKRPISVPVLHWWNGSNSRTKVAVELGCYFSLNSRIAGYSRFAASVPIDRIFTETDQGYDEPPSAIPGRIEDTERLISDKYDLEREGVRRVIWKNFGAVVTETGIKSLVSAKLVDLAAVG